MISGGQYQINASWYSAAHEDFLSAFRSALRPGDVWRELGAAGEDSVLCCSERKLSFLQSMEPKLNLPQLRSPYLAKAVAILCYAILLIGAGTVFSAAYLTKAAYSTVPMWDDWKLLDGYIQQPHLTWIWAQLNEHRIIFYKLLMIADLRFFEGKDWPAFAAIYGCQILICILFAYMLQKFGGFERSLWAVCFGLALYTYFCPCQWENFAYGLQFSFLLTNLWMMIALVGVLLQGQRIASGQPGGSGLLAVSLLGCVGATFCGANGIVVWIVALMAAFFARLPWRLVAWYAAGMIIISPLYFIGYHSVPTHPPPLATLRQPLGVLEYIENLLGGVVLPNSQLDWALQIGQVALLFSVFLLVRFVIRRSKNSLLEIGLAGITVYSLATGFLTALGRLILGTNSAFTARYQTFSLQFWLAITVWSIFILAQQKAAKSLALLFLAIMALLTSSVRLYKPVLDGVRTWVFVHRESAGSLLAADIHDDDFVRTTVFRIPEMVWSDVAYLRGRHLSLFSTAISGQIGANLTPTYDIVPADKCEGSVDKVSRVGAKGEGIKVDGWTVDRSDRRPTERVLFAAGTRIIGFGVSGAPRPDVATGSPLQPCSSQWLGRLCEGSRGNENSGCLRCPGLVPRKGRMSGCDRTDCSLAGATVANYRISISPIIVRQRAEVSSPAQFSAPISSYANPSRKPQRYRRSASTG